HVLPDTPEIRARADLAGRDLTEPRTGAPRAEPRAPEVFHRGGDDQARVEPDDRVFRPEGERIEGPHADGADPEIAFHGRPQRVSKRDDATLRHGQYRVLGVTYDRLLR